MHLQRDLSQNVCSNIVRQFSAVPSPKSILKKYPTVAVSLPASVPALVAPDHEPLPPSRLDVPLSTNGAFTNGSMPPASGALIRRRPAVGVLDIPISVCTRFATWLENQRCVHDETLLRAVERDGRRLLCLAKATVTFENALRGNVPSVNGAVSPLMEHARTLRVFAEILDVKIAEGSLSEELETAVLRDGEALLRLAICCLEFDQTIRGSGSAQVK
ncbi:hypothetical protein J3R82DRAFT_11328 [Butyriboletus roseoflavus]|nr:hypothetical protein J3R82DRAFT_11328 [Butyriboletus roseoflavus]